MPWQPGKDETWYVHEAIMRMDYALANGKPLIDPNFCPIEIIKDQVPKVGEWEEEYLAHQPTTYPNFVDPFQVIQLAGDADIY